MPTRVLLVSHEPEAAPGLIGEILRARGYDIDHHTVLADPSNPDVAYPDPSEYDAIITFGSFANAYDPAARPWVDPEVAWVTQIVERDVPYLGVCFGGQLLSESLGGSVVRAPEGSSEIGLVAFESDASLPVPSGPWFTWHEDVMVLPDGVEVLARNDASVQLFRRGRAVGTQFHPEANLALVGEWVRIGPDHIPSHTSANELLGDLTAQQDALRANCEQLIDWFMEEIASAPGGRA